MIIVPGINGSGPEHWQSLWERPTDVRITPTSWDEPDLDDWVRALDVAAAVARRADESTAGVVVAHSLGCLAVAHWLSTAPRTVTGALLVAPPDPDAATFPVDAPTFRAAQVAPLGIPAVVVGSTNDHYAAPSFVAGFAARMGARYVETGAHGHLNAESGLGDWPRGRAILDEVARRHA